MGVVGPVTEVVDAPESAGTQIVPGTVCRVSTRGSDPE
jgi:hypothetical protein